MTFNSNRNTISSASLTFEPTGDVGHWHTLPLFGRPALEDHISWGDTDERQKARQDGHPYAVRVPVAKMPLDVWQTLRWVSRCTRQAVPSLAAASRYAARCGLEVLARIHVIPELEQAFDKAYLTGTATQRALLVGHSFDGFANIGSRPIYGRKLSLFYRTHAGVSELADALGLPVSTLALGAVVAGLAQSITFVPDRYIAKFARAVIEFCCYLEDRVSDLRPLLDVTTWTNESDI